MFNIGKYIRNRWLRTVRDESGSATVETVLWLPVFVMFLSLVVDVSLIFGSQSLAFKTVQDENRRFAVGTTTTMAELETRLTDRLAVYSPNATVTATIADGVVATNVTMPARDLSFSGFFDPLNALQITVYSEHLLEDFS